MQSVALTELGQLGGQELREVLPDVRRKLVVWANDDDGAVGQLMWVVTELNDSLSISLLRQLARRPELYISRHAEAVITYLEGGIEAVLDCIRDNDQAHFLWLSRIAWSIGTPNVLEAFRACAASAADEASRSLCERFYRSLEHLRAERDPPFWRERLPR